MNRYLDENRKITKIQKQRKCNRLKVSQATQDSINTYTEQPLIGIDLLMKTGESQNYKCRQNATDKKFGKSYLNTFTEQPLIEIDLSMKTGKLQTDKSRKNVKKKTLTGHIRIL